MASVLSNLTPPLKWHGGKNYLASRIVALMPRHVHYVEAFAGGLSVMLAKAPQGISEVANDINLELMHFWKVLQEPAYFNDFARRLQATPFSQFEWDESRSLSIEAGTLDRAVAFFIHCRQSLAGRMASFAPLSRTRTRRGMNEQASAWMGAVDGLAEVHARLRRVAILASPAAKCIEQQDGPETLFYLDPPYVDQTRSTPDVYRHEMTVADHGELLDLIKRVKGKVMLSGYDCELYRRSLGDWIRHDFDLPNNSAGGKSKRRMVECLWCNF